MHISPFVWIATIAGILALLAFDFFFHVRKAHEPTLKESALWSAVYVGIALLFGVGLWVVAGSGSGADYFAGYITEKALSVDNLFVFLVIMSAFAVPRAYQQKVLLFGIAFALVSRGILVALGAAMINTFSWTFYIFGLVLLLTAGHMFKPEGEDQHSADNLITRVARKLFHASDDYDGDKLFTRVDDRRVMTPMLLVMIVIGGSDILFALDAIPAIYGLTEQPYIVFTATAFSLLGLRQLYFLIDELLDRLVFLSYGLAVILGFIGVKLLLHALHKNSLPFINDGEPVHLVELSTPVSLGVIVGVLVVTVVASLAASRRKDRSNA